MAANNNGSLPANLPILVGKNYDNWCIQVRVLFRFQDVLGIVKKGVPTLEANATDQQKQAHRKNIKRDGKALFLLHQGVDAVNFEKISSLDSAKEAWDALENAYAGVDKVKKVRLQTLRRQYELLSMEDQESAAAYFTRIRTLVNLMKTCGEKITDQLLVEKVLRTLTPRFDHIVVAIEESKDLEALKLDESQSSIEAHEQRLNERSKDKASEQALQAQFSHRHDGENNKNKKGKWQPQRWKGSGADQSSSSNPNSGDNRNKKHDDKNKLPKKKFNKKGVQCYNCQKFGHYADECKGKKDEAQLAHDGASNSENEQVLLMVTMNSENAGSDQWYLDTRCSNHMSGRKEWFFDLNDKVKSKIRFADNSVISAEGVAR